MNYKPRPTVGEILVVPLSHPSGAYIRIDGNVKVPIIAKVRSVFSDTVNVINYFGYIYNVPISHTEPVNLSVSTKFYTDMVDSASLIMRELGYKSLDNSEFYNTAYAPVNYSFLSYLPDYVSMTHSPKPVMYPTDSPGPSYKYKDRSDTQGLQDEIGTIHVMDLDKKSLLHVVEKSKRTVLFNSDTGELTIRGYGTFLIETSYTYKKENNEYQIFRSKRNFIHIKKKYIKQSTYENIAKNQYYYVKTIKLNSQKEQHKKFMDISKIIKREYRDI